MALALAGVPSALARLSLMILRNVVLFETEIDVGSSA